ncbi:MAG: alanine--tRNA ligase [Promethearchaeota archaeon]
MNRKTLITKYINFFIEKPKNHKAILSASLYPENDPSALFISAGMHPLVPYLLGEKHPLGTRLTNVQKCIRTGDIDEVGDRTHLTFFEMLGNWSLGDYGKQEAISWSYAFLTEEKWLNMDPKMLSVTLYEGDDQLPRDDESARIWMSLGIPKERLFFLPRKDNVWGPVGNTGPCGPCTEMFFDIGLEKCGINCRPGCSCGKYVEVWNDVFMFFEKQEDGTYKELKQKNIDTGMGVERMLSVINGVQSVFEIYIFEELINILKNHVDKENFEKEEIHNIRIIIDHVRSAIFALADPKRVTPSNIEQGYVIRRLLRRIIVKLRQINLSEEIIFEMVNPIIEIFGKDYPELVKNKDFIISQIDLEIKRFTKTLSKGLRHFEKLISKNKDKSYGISGKEAFMLFSSFGFPIEIIKELLDEKGYDFDQKSFDLAFNKHKDISRTATKGKFQSGLTDHSEIATRYHTLTHLMHQALRNLLGDSVHQVGSNITSDRTRFDVSFNRKLSHDELIEVEKQIKKIIESDLTVKKEIMTPEVALSQGALGFFKDVYNEKVSVFSVGNYSKEICTGPHVEHTALIGAFKIYKQKKIGVNILRIYGKIIGDSTV